MAATDTAVRPPNPGLSSRAKKPAVKASKARQDAEIAKLHAEAAEHLAAAELAREQVEDAKIERRITSARAVQAENDAAGSVISLNALKRDEAKHLAQDSYHRVYQFDSGVTATAVKTCISTLSLWSRLDPGCAIEIVFNSPGGSVIDGFALWDFLTELKSKGHHLTTVCRGMAASMGGILLQAGDVRVVGAESVILVHEISFGAGGKIGEVEDSVEFAKMLTKRVLRIFESRTKMTAAQIDRKWKRTDWWMDSDEALERGFADEIR